MPILREPISWMIASVVALVVFLGFDIGQGTTLYFPATVTAHHYVPETSSVHSDSDGQITTTTYPEEFHLICQGSQLWDITTTRTLFYTVTNNQPIHVVRRAGRFTHLQYPYGFVPAIEQ